MNKAIAQIGILGLLSVLPVSANDMQPKKLPVYTPKEGGPGYYPKTADEIANDQANEAYKKYQGEKASAEPNLREKKHEKGTHEEVLSEKTTEKNEEEINKRSIEQKKSGIEAEQAKSEDELRNIDQIINYIEQEIKEEIGWGVQRKLYGASEKEQLLEKEKAGKKSDSEWHQGKLKEYASDLKGHESNLEQIDARLSFLDNIIKSHENELEKVSNDINMITSKLEGLKTKDTLYEKLKKAKKGGVSDTAAMAALAQRFLIKLDALAFLYTTLDEKISNLSNTPEDESGMKGKVIQKFEEFKKELLKKINDFKRQKSEFFNKYKDQVNKSISDSNAPIVNELVKKLKEKSEFEKDLTNKKKKNTFDEINKNIKTLDIDIINLKNKSAVYERQRYYLNKALEESELSKRDLNEAQRVKSH